MKKWKLGLFLIVATLAGCAQDSTNVDVVLSSSNRPLISAKATSCLAAKGASTESQDIAADYFSIPVLTFNRKDVTKDLIISRVIITITLPSGPYKCDLGGDGLAALSSSWYANPGKETVIPAGTASFKTDCALYCGGIPVDTDFSATGTLEIRGLERNPDSLEETNVKTQTSITVQTY